MPAARRSVAVVAADITALIKSWPTQAKVRRNKPPVLHQNKILNLCQELAKLVRISIATSVGSHAARPLLIPDHHRAQAGEDATEATAHALTDFIEHLHPAIDVLLGPAVTAARRKECVQPIIKSLVTHIACLVYDSPVHAFNLAAWRGTWGDYAVKVFSEVQHCLTAGGISLDEAYTDTADKLVKLMLNAHLSSTVRVATAYLYIDLLHPRLARTTTRDKYLSQILRAFNSARSFDLQSVLLEIVYRVLPLTAAERVNFLQQHGINDSVWIDLFTDLANAPNDLNNVMREHLNRINEQNFTDAGPVTFPAYVTVHHAVFQAGTDHVQTTADLPMFIDVSPEGIAFTAEMDTHADEEPMLCAKHDRIARWAIDEPNKKLVLALHDVQVPWNPSIKHDLVVQFTLADARAVTVARNCLLNRASGVASTSPLGRRTSELQFPLIEHRVEDQAGPGGRAGAVATSTNGHDHVMDPVTPPPPPSPPHMGPPSPAPAQATPPPAVVPVPVATARTAQVTPPPPATVRTTSTVTTGPASSSATPQRATFQVRRQTIITSPRGTVAATAGRVLPAPAATAAAEMPALAPTNGAPQATSSPRATANVAAARSSKRPRSPDHESSDTSDFAPAPVAARPRKRVVRRASPPPPPRMPTSPLSDAVTPPPPPSPPRARPETRASPPLPAAHSSPEVVPIAHPPTTTRVRTAPSMQMSRVQRVPQRPSGETRGPTTTPPAPAAASRARPAVPESSAEDHGLLDFRKFIGRKVPGKPTAVKPRAEPASPVGHRDDDDEDMMMMEPPSPPPIPMPAAAPSSPLARVSATQQQSKPATAAPASAARAPPAPAVAEPRSRPAVIHEPPATPPSAAATSTTAAAVTDASLPVLQEILHQMRMLTNAVGASSASASASAFATPMGPPPAPARFQQQGAAAYMPTPAITPMPQAAYMPRAEGTMSGLRTAAFGSAFGQTPAATSYQWAPTGMRGEWEPPRAGYQAGGVFDPMRAAGATEPAPGLRGAAETFFGASTTTNGAMPPPPPAPADPAAAHGIPPYPTQQILAIFTDAIQDIGRRADAAVAAAQAELDQSVAHARALCEQWADEWVKDVNAGVDDAEQTLRQKLAEIHSVKPGVQNAGVRPTAPVPGMGMGAETAADATTRARGGMAR
ncbi:hypothetical protein GGF32_006095 [Allomyces javanicus]|nr:hypothetical protein GGF32_006095 [Allomyces javanicus]